MNSCEETWFCSDEQIETKTIVLFLNVLDSFARLQVKKSINSHWFAEANVDKIDKRKTITVCNKKTVSIDS